MATSVLQIDSRPTKVDEPYVGLRPFERTERSIFFGRERDATFLADKIFSAKLTLLYAPSGVGKSSILRTLVIPLLEDQHARVVYFDAWAGEDPSALLNATLTQLASKLGVPDPGRGEPTLIELVGLLTSVDERTVILILDQFEEFLVNHSNQLDPLREELASLVRASGLDVRVVLSLRQEFLAALEPFRHEILNLFQSTYLLDSLDEKGVRDAIECPVALFGETYESKLVDQLVVDLRAEGTQSLLPGATVPIDLPMMQLVCGQLWEAASKRDQTTLTLLLYQGLGRAERILDTYVRNVMPSRWSERLLTAKLMKGLAPSSGFKRPYSADELADIENLDRGHVASELERLSRSRILRTREFRGQVLYELQHDAFIRIIAPWRDNVLRSAKTRHRTFLALGIVLVAALASWTAFKFLAKDRLEVRANSFGVMNDLRKMSPEEQAKQAALRFDFVTTYLLQKKRYDLLKQLLEENKDLLPTGYGLHNVEGEGATIAPQRDQSHSNREQLFCLHYSSQRQLKETYFDREWQYLASSYFAAQWGIPVPSKLQLKREHAFPKLEVRLTTCANEQEVILDRTVPSYEDEVVVASNELNADGKEFLKRFGKEWHSVPGESDDRLWIVPRWSRPVWKVSGSPAVDGSGLPAMLVAFDLRKNPEQLFANGGASFLIDRVGRRYPATVREALAARGDRVDGDFAELVKRGRPLSDPVIILDELALYPDDDSRTVAEKVDSDLRAAQPSFPAHLRGPWKTPAQKTTVQVRTDLQGKKANSRNVGSALRNVATGNSPVKEQTPYRAAYEEVSAFLPLGGNPIQIYLGQTLKSAWRDDDEPGRKLGEVRDGLFRQSGVELSIPSPFTRSFGSESLAPAAFRIVSTADFDPGCNKQVMNSAAADALPRLISLVQHCAGSHTIYWITSESVAQQRGAATPDFRNWLEANYSVTDQKLLMRAVLFRPANDSNVSLSSAQAGNLPPEYTLRYQDWLLHSLVFWAQTDDDPHDTMKVSQYLRDTQHARLAPVAANSGNQKVVQLVTDGIRALESGRILAAKSSFIAAIRLNRNAAIQEFLSRYPQALAPTQEEEFAKLCSDGSAPYLGYMDLPHELDLEDLLAQNDNLLDPVQRRHLGLCLLHNYEYEPHQKQVLLQTDLLRRYNDPEQWPAEEARWLAVNILAKFDPYADPPELRQAAAALLISAVRENRSDRLSSEASLEVFDGQLKSLDQPGPKQWSWKLVDDLAKARPELGILEGYGAELTTQEREECLRRALQLAEEIKARTKGNTTSQERISAVDWADYIRAGARQGLYEIGIDERGDEEAQVIYQRLRHSSTVNIPQYSELRIMEFESARGQYAEVLSSLHGTLQPTPERPELYLEKLLAELLSGNSDGASKTAAEAASRAHEADEDNRPAMLFVAALGELLTNSPNFEETSRKFLDTNHPYVPYIAMILAAQMTQKKQAAQDAQSVLRELLPKAEKRHWKERLREGDETAWREMLIGYYLKEVTRDEIFGELEDYRRFANSDLRFVMSRRGELCEAYFYDALLARAEGDKAREQADLQKVLDTQMKSYTEYDLAKFLLSQKDSSQ